MKSLRSKSAFKSHAETMLRRSNSDAAGYLDIEWEFIGPVCAMKGAPGKMRHGHFLATAEGYGTVRVFVSETTYGFSVRPGGQVRVATAAAK